MTFTVKGFKVIYSCTKASTMETTVNKGCDNYMKQMFKTCENALFLLLYKKNKCVFSFIYIYIYIYVYIYLYFYTITNFYSHYHYHYYFFVILCIIVIAVIISLFSVLLTFIFLVFIIVFYLCMYRIFLNSKQMAWPNIVQSW